MDFGPEWGWVTFAYVVTYASLIGFGASMAIRIKRARHKLGERS
jgi:hypothetical protein